MRLVLGRHKSHEARRSFSGAWRGRAIRPLSVALGIAWAVVLAPVSAGRSQIPMQNVGGPNNYKPYYPGIQKPVESSDGYEQVALERELNALNIERQKEIVSDSNKLLRLARELNEEVAANSSSTLTVDQLHQIAQIEKLARGIKQKMADGVGQPVLPTVQIPVSIPAP